MSSATHASGAWPRWARALLHTILVFGALVPGLGMGDAPPRVAPAAVVVMWAGARHSRGLLRGVYASFAGIYAGIVFSVILWPWVADPPWWSIVGVIAAVGTWAFATARMSVSWRAGLAYAVVVLPLIVAFFVALTVANPFELGWSRSGL